MKQCWLPRTSVRDRQTKQTQKVRTVDPSMVQSQNQAEIGLNKARFQRTHAKSNKKRLITHGQVATVGVGCQPRQEAMLHALEPRQMCYCCATPHNAAILSNGANMGIVRGDQRTMVKLDPPGTPRQLDTSHNHPQHFLAFPHGHIDMLSKRKLRVQLNLNRARSFEATFT